MCVCVCVRVSLYVHVKKATLLSSLVCTRKRGGARIYLLLVPPACLLFYLSFSRSISVSRSLSSLSFFSPSLSESIYRARANPCTRWATCCWCLSYILLPPQRARTRTDTPYVHMCSGRAYNATGIHVRCATRKSSTYLFLSLFLPLSDGIARDKN